MTRNIKAEQWRPVGGKVLEEVAAETARIDKSRIVIAGPGSGKSELLAQRAAYLFETGRCRSPQQILAICFKRDAAFNLASRIEERCGRGAASRFSSKTYDAFAVSLVNQFRSAIPQEYRPSSDYVIEPNVRKAVGAAFGDSISTSSLNELATAHMFGAVRVPLPDESHPLTNVLWRRLLDASPSVVTFAMLCAIAERLLLDVDFVRNALRATYSYVFLDEFQDTTTAQYRLIRAAFCGSSAVLTAVGDDRQRIMVWAGADKGVFGDFCRDFSAERVSLVLNHRSAANLVEMQRVIAGRMIGESVEIVSGKQLIKNGICEIHWFSSYKDEARSVADIVFNWIQNEQLLPRQICILVKQKPDEYSKLLIAELHKLGVRARVESDLQDLMTEPMFETVVSFIRLAMPGQWPREYDYVVRLIAELRGFDVENDDGRAIAKAERQVDYFLTDLRVIMDRYLNAGIETGQVARLISRIMKFLGPDSYRSMFRRYNENDAYANMARKLSTAIGAAVAKASSWLGGVELMIGNDCVPIMTIHKSKGLEFDAVVFVGLEDGAFWNFRKQPEEDTCAFYVALSRARRHLVFTFSSVRNSGKGGTEQKESAQEIRSLYGALKGANVPKLDMRNKYR